MRQSKNTRDSILFAAVNCFAEKGFHGTTIREIGTACNVTDPTIYHYFKDKEHLFREALESTHHIFFLVLQGALVRSRDLRTELSSYFFAFTEWGKSVRQGPRAYIETSAAHVLEFFHTTPISMKAEFSARFHAKFTRLIKETMAAHDMKDNLKSVVTFFSTLIYGFSDKLARLGSDAYTLDEVLDAVEQTMQFIFRTQKNIDASMVEWELSAPSMRIEDIRQAVQKRLLGYPHKIFSFKDFRAYIRYGQPT